MKHNLLLRIASLLLVFCLLPTGALAYGDVPVFKVPVTRADMTITFDVHPDGFPYDGAADYKGWQTFLDKLSVKGILDVQQPFTDDVRAWFDGGLYVKERLTVPFQMDVYMKYRYLISRALRDESIYFQMDNFFEFMMKPRYYMELPTNLIALLMYPEATLTMRDRFYTPLEELCAGEGKRTVSYDDLYNLCLQWEDMYMNDPEDTYKLYYYITSLLYDLGINYDVYDKLGMMTDYLNLLDPEGKGMTITEKKGWETYTIGETVVFTRQLGEARNYTLTLPDETGSVLTLISEEQLGSWEGDDWQLTLRITRPAEEEGGEPVNYLTMVLDMDDIPLREHYETNGTIRFRADGLALENPISADFNLILFRNDIELPNMTRWTLSYIHPETGLACFTACAEMWQQEESYTVLQERAYPQEDFFHLNDEFLQRIKEQYIPSLAISFLPVVVEMPAGVINDIIRFAEETDILVSLGLE